MRLSDLSIKTKLAAGFGIVLALLVVVATSAVVGLGDSRESFLQMRGLDGEHIRLNDRFIDHQDWVLAVANGLVAGDVGDVKVEPDPTRCNLGRWYYGQGRIELQAEVPATIAPLREMEPLHNALHASLATIKAAPDPRVARDVYKSTTLPAIQGLRVQFDRVDSAIDVATDRVSQSLSARAVLHNSVVTFASITAVVLGALIAYFLARSITVPLAQVVTEADAIGRGELDAVDYHGEAGLERADEIGTLRRSFASMVGSLSSMAGAMTRVAGGDLTVDVTPRSERDVMGTAMQQMTRQLREFNAQIQNAAEVLATTVTQIKASSAELSATSAETAAAISQTSATVAQVKQTAGVSAEKAGHMSATASHATEVAREGRSAAEQSMDGMQAISQKMEFIAENIVRLSEKSQDISDIINAVRELAEQSNILAVNASIEASKAGAEGRGFAVVATEIKNLAEQSKESTVQVRAILGDIQKATAASVMATEEGGKSVDTGYARSAGAREAIAKLEETVQQAARASTLIAASAKEELVGMDQVAAAMTNIDQASAQTLESAKQLDASVDDLGELAESLRTMLASYKV